MLIIRPYLESDAEVVGQLIAETYARYNLDFASPAETKALLGPFQHAGSTEERHQEAIARAIRSQTVIVAEEDGAIVGVLRGRRERLGSLFVRGDRHRCGIGRMLVDTFEKDSVDQGVTVIRVASSLLAVPFYLKLGYSKSTGVRAGWSFDGRGLKIQPMTKSLTGTGSATDSSGNPVCGRARRERHGR